MKIPLTRATKIIAICLVAASLAMYFIVCPRYVPDITDRKSVV